MKNATLLSARDNLIQHVHMMLENVGGDYSAMAVIFPGKRPAHFLRKAIAERRQTASIPPHIFSIDSFVDYLCERHLLLHGPDIGELDAVALLFSIHSALERRLGGQAFDTLDLFLPLGLKLFDALEDLRLGLVSPEKLRSVLGLTRFPNGDRLGEYYEKFYDEVRREGATTRAMRYAAAADPAAEWNLTEFHQVVVAGFFMFSTAEEHLMRRLSDHKSATFVFQSCRGKFPQLHSLGFNLERTDTPETLPTFSLYGAAGTHGQIFGVNSVLEEFARQSAPIDEHTVIVLPSPDGLFPVIQWTLPPISPSKYNISLGYPGNRTPVFGFLNTLIELVANAVDGRVYAPDYLRLLAHPYFKSIEWRDNSGVTRILANTVESWLADRRGWRFLMLDDIENDEELHTLVANALHDTAPDCSATEVKAHLAQLHTVFIQNLLSAATLGAFANTLADILTFVDVHTSAWQHESFRSFALAILKELRALSTSRLAAFSTQTYGRYGSVVHRCLLGVSVPFEGTPVEGLQILGFLETRNLQFDRVIILDANDDVIPGSADVDPLLPPALRRSLGLATNEQREQISSHYFDVLVRGAAEVHFFYRDDGKGERSRFVERLLWEHQKALASIEEGEFVRSVRFPIKLGNIPPNPIVKTAAIFAAMSHARYSASAIDCYLECRLRYYYRYLLHLDERRQVEDGLDPADVGLFVHSVLAEIDRLSLGRPLAPVTDRSQEVRAAAESVFRAQFGASADVSQLLLKDQVERQVLAYQQWYSETILARHEVELLGIERQLECQWEGVAWTGRADRIERRGEQVVIIDYKTAGQATRLRFRPEKYSADVRTTWGEAVGSFQLPLYLLMFSELERVPVESLAAQFTILGAHGFSAESESWLFGGPEHNAEQWNMLLEILRNVLREMLDPNVTFAPAEDLQHKCPGCPFTVLCGTTWTRKREDWD